MELKEYLDKIWKDDVIVFAKKCGVGKSTLYAWLGEKRRPLRKSAIKIEEITEGKVTFEELRKKTCKKKSIQ